MKKTVFLFYFLTPSVAFAETSTAADVYFAYGIVISVAVLLVITLGLTRRDLIKSPWSLSDALSEEASTNLLDANGKPILDGDQKPVMLTLMRASSSRLIALMGLIGIFSLFIGFGLVLLKDFALKGTLPDSEVLAKIQNYFYTGLTMFAPYLINKAASAFDFLSPLKTP